MSKKFTYTLFMLSLFALAKLPASAQLHKSIQLKGGAGHLTGPLDAVPTINNNATIEAWVYVPVAESGPRYFLSQGDFYLGYDGSNGNEIIAGTAWDPNTTTTVTGVSLPIGQWNHIAVVAYNNGFDADLYLNGKKVSTTLTFGSGQYFTTGAGSQFLIGTNQDSTVFMNGFVDNVRIWNIVRTASDIKDFMYASVDQTTLGLQYYYTMDEGSGSATANKTATTNADLVFQSPTDLAWGNGPAIGANNALVFYAPDNTQAVAPASTSYEFTAGTIEADIRPDDNNNSAVFLAQRGGGASRWSLHLTNSGGVNRISLYNSTDGLGWIDLDTVPTPLSFNIGQWYHVSAVTAHSTALNRDTTGVYIDGVYYGKIIGVFNGGQLIGYDNTVTNKDITIGANGEGGEQFTGAIDEVRLWNTPLTQAQILTNMGTRLTGGETNLAGLWSFDQGISDGDNTGLKVAGEKVAGNAAILNNTFALSGSGTNVTNFTLNVLTPLPVTFGKFTVTRQGSSALLKWQTYQEHNSQDFVIERSASGTDFVDIGSVPAAGESRTLLNYTFSDNDPLEGTNYYRILERDKDAKSQYSVIQSIGFTKAGGLVWYSTGAAAVEIRLQKGSTEFYSITDVSGNTIRTGRLTDGRTTLTGVSGGIYFVKVRNAAGADLTTKVMLP